MVPWSFGVTAHGFRGHTEFAVAVEEGGPANGVRTAIDDFLQDRPGYRTIHLPCVFGLMFIFPSDAPWADEMVARFGVYDENPLLSRLERNRIELYLQVLKLQDKLGVEHVKTANLVAELEARTQDLSTLWRSPASVCGRPKHEPRVWRRLKPSGRPRLSLVSAEW